MYKVILDCDLMRHKHSGLYYYCLNLGTHLTKILDTTGEGSIAMYTPKHVERNFNGTLKCIAEKRWHHKFFKPFLWDCDIWHAPFQSGRMIVPKKNSTTKIVLTIHDLNCLHEGRTDSERVESLHHTQKLIDRADALICVSNHCKNDVMTYLDIKHKPLRVIHNGSQEMCITPPKPSGFKPSRPFIFTIGYVNRKKNFHSLVPLLLNSDFDLIIAGKLDDADYVNKMRLQARKLGVSDKLHILGPVSEEDKSWYLKNCMAFMLPSLAEGFGIPVVEAMQFGKPLFLSNLTSLPEIGSDVAFYFDSFKPEHMENVFNAGMSEYRRNGLVNRIIKRGKEFCWEEKAKEYLQLYRSLI